tara:strand:- start:1467 stop:2420 length:954 start_codon:yes stop_codon:yes gene_type:complete
MQAKRSRCEAGGSSSAPGSSSVPGSTLAQAIGEARTQLDSVFNPLLGADGLLEQLRAKLGEQCQVAEQEAGEQQDALSQQKQSLQREVELMEHAAGQLKEVVKLNIGGTLFRTSRATLTATPSMLATMFSGRHAVPTDDDGSVFIDRDGRHFHHVLNYLRTGSAVLPQADDAQQELLVEADYYQLGGLIEALSGKGRFERQLGPLNVALRDREDEVRRLFAQEPTSPLLADQHLALLDVFANLRPSRPPPTRRGSSCAQPSCASAGRFPSGRGPSLMEPSIQKPTRLGARCFARSTRCAAGFRLWSARRCRAPYASP